MSPRSKKISQEMRARSRRFLIDSARELFADGGYHNCKVSDIARKAGMSQGNVYWYFSGKEELFKTVLREGFESLGSGMSSVAGMPVSSLEKLDALIDHMISFGRENSEFNTIILSVLGQGGDEKIQEIGFDMSHIRLGYTQSVMAIMSQAQSEGVIGGDIAPVLLTMLFFGLFNGLNLTYGRDWLELPVDQVKRAAKRMVGVKEGVNI
jgi:AcrR family transcriptional regulator